MNLNSFFTNLIKKGITRTQFYLGLLFLFLAPILNKIPNVLVGEKSEVTAVRIIDKNRGHRPLRRIYRLENKYTLWQYKSKGVTVIFEGARGDLHKTGQKTTAYVNIENPEKSFTIHWLSIYNNVNGGIVLGLIIFWISLFFVYGHSEKEWLQVRLIKKWYLKLLALLAVMFVIGFLVVIPTWAVLTFGWYGLIGFAFLTLMISPQLKSIYEFFLYSEEQLKERALKKQAKRAADARELNAEIARRRKRKK